jgi:hypothetical protein
LKIIRYPKAELVKRMAAEPPRLFANPGQILHNPHFRRSLSSREKAKIARAIVADGTFALSVAPHIRPLRMRLQNH